MIVVFQRIFFTFLYGFGAGIVPSAISLGDEWPTFRGSKRTAVVDDSRLLKAWPDGGPKLLWEGVGAGRGYASLAIVEGKIYTLGDGLSQVPDEDEYLTCFDQATGKRIWFTKTGKPWSDRQKDWESSRSTPTVNEGMVYVVTPYGQLVCCQATDGKTVWTKQLKEELGGKKDDGWGYSESVLVDGNLLICTPGGPKSTMVAIDKKTGSVVWTCANAEDRGAGHSSVVISKVGNSKVYVQTTGSGLMGVSTQGELLWTYPIDKTTAVIPTAIVKDEFVFMPVGYKRGGALVKQVPAANGKIEVEEIYGLNPKLANKHGGVVRVGDYLYGDSDDAGRPYCADFMTGEIKWTSRGSGERSAVVIASNDRLYLRFQNGIMVLAEANPTEYKEVGKFTIPGSGKRPSWSHPVIVDGKLYLREQDSILCYDIRS